jgi:hypothetical protein
MKKIKITENNLISLIEKVITESPEKETYWVLSKSAIETLKNYGKDGDKTTEEQIRAIGGAATDNFKKYC